MLTPEEQEILSRIQVPSEDDPLQPEYPPAQPRFPATETVRIDVPGFSNVWLKDESGSMYSGTHKDRLAWEVVVLYRDFLRAKEQGLRNGALPQFSLITSGSAGTAIGRTLKAYNLPKLKVLVDTNIDPHIAEALKEAHCEVFFIDLSAKELMSDEILAATNNPHGFDLTSNQGIALEIGNYDWMSFEILNESPEFVFVPFGTGTIYKKLLEVAKDVVRMPHHDRRYRGDVSALRRCSYLGATTNNPKSKANKLYSPFLPFANIGKDWIRFYKAAGYCGELTDIYSVEEKYIEEAHTMLTAQGVVCEHSGSAGLALLLQIKEQIPKDKKILIVNTGKLKL